MPTPQQLFDRLVSALWEAAHELGVEPSVYEPSLLLDVLTRHAEEIDFPYPGSPRLDGAGGSGGRRTAPDGSPGVPETWLRWAMREDRAKKAMPGISQAPVVLVQAWLARYEPKLWALYRDRVLRGAQVSHLALRYQLSPAQVSRGVARARALLFTQLGVFMGETSAEEVAQLLAQLRPPTAPALTPAGA